MARSVDAAPPRSKAAFLTLFLALGSVLAVLVFAEFAMRWHANGLRGALRSLWPGTHATTWVVPDAELGYKLNPERPGVNSLGMRSPELAPKRDGDPFRLLVIGDSVAYDREGFVTMLRERLAEPTPTRAAVEVLNGSVPGYTTHQERVLLERDLLALGADLVLLQYCTNDNHRFLHEIDPTGQWVMTARAREALLPGDGQSWLVGLLERSFLMTRLRVGLLNAIDDAGAGNPFPWTESSEYGNAWLDATWPAAEAELRAIRDATAARGAAFAIVALPGAWQIEPSALEADRDYTRKPQRRLAEVAARLGVPLLDLHPDFERARERGLFRDLVHLTVPGHEIVAECVEAFLARERLLPDA